MKIKSCPLPKPLVKKEKFNFEFGHFISTVVSHETRQASCCHWKQTLSRGVWVRDTPPPPPTSVMKASPIYLNL